MLPPNLTRHYWEARRAYLGAMGQSDGFPITPWFQLTPTERLVVEKEVELLRQAIRTAEEEQDLVAALTPSVAAPASGAPTAETPAEEQPSVSKPTTAAYPVAGEVRMYVSSNRQLPIRYEVLLSPLPDRATLDKKPPQEDRKCLGCSAVATFLKLTSSKYEPRPAPENADTKAFGATGPQATKHVNAEEARGPQVDAFGQAVPRPLFAEPVIIGFDVPTLTEDMLRWKVSDLFAAEIRRDGRLRNIGPVI
ncbi:hypothetical protein [Streptomyces anulatus]|uniref:hypothetical protein n=1 Tax=Streptomyces anulatus TaxID=1892 RepID=UPI0037DD5A0C|nr:hypothetical protein OHB50_39445 [Streptomyces anulatus]